MQQNDKKSSVLIERISQFVKYLEISESKFGQKLGKDRSFLSTLKQRGGISAETLCEIASVYTNLNMDWLITGRGEMTYKTSSMTIVNEPTTRYNSQQNITDTIPLTTYNALKELVDQQKQFINQLLEKNR